MSVKKVTPRGLGSCVILWSAGSGRGLSELELNKDKPSLTARSSLSARKEDWGAACMPPVGKAEL